MTKDIMKIWGEILFWHLTFKTCAKISYENRFAASVYCHILSSPKSGVKGNYDWTCFSIFIFFILKLILSFFTYVWLPEKTVRMSLKMFSCKMLECEVFFKCFSYIKDVEKFIEINYMYCGNLKFWKVKHRYELDNL